MSLLFMFGIIYSSFDSVKLLFGEYLKNISSFLILHLNLNNLLKYSKDFSITFTKKIPTKL